jgi:hypothetical protein
VKKFEYKSINNTQENQSRVSCCRPPALSVARQATTPPVGLGTLGGGWRLATRLTAKDQAGCAYHAPRSPQFSPSAPPWTFARGAIIPRFKDLFNLITVLAWAVPPEACGSRRRDRGSSSSSQQHSRARTVKIGLPVVRLPWAGKK